MDIAVDEHTRLRGLREQDAEALFVLVDEDRERLREWLTWVDDTQSEKDTLNFVLMTLRKRKERSALVTGIWHEGILCGVIGFNTISEQHSRAEIGYWIAADWEGRSIVTTSCRAMVSYGFEELGLHRVTIQCAIKNRRSQAVPERLGFFQEGVLRDYTRNGNRFDSMVVYSMLRPDWT